MRPLLRGFAVSALFLIVPALHAQARSAGSGVTRPNMLVSTGWLATHARDADLVVLHVGRRAQ